MHMQNCEDTVARESNGSRSDGDPGITSIAKRHKGMDWQPYLKGANCRLR